MDVEVRKIMAPWRSEKGQGEQTAGQPNSRTISTPTTTTTQQLSSNQQAKMTVGSEEDSLNDDDENVFALERSLGCMAVANQFSHSQNYENEFESYSFSGRGQTEEDLMYRTWS